MISLVADVIRETHYGVISTSRSDDEISSVNRNYRNSTTDANSEKIAQDSLIMSKKVAGQMKAVTDLFTRQLERLCNLMHDLRETV